MSRRAEGENEGETEERLCTKNICKRDKWNDRRNIKGDRRVDI